MNSLSVKLGPLELDNPILTASGTFGYGKEFDEFVDLNRLGGIVTKSLTPKPRPGNPPHRVTEVTGAMLNSIGLANVGVDRFIQEKMSFLQTLNCKVVVNIAGESLEEYVTVLTKLETVPSGIDAYEINLSCPNVKEGGRTFGKDPKQVHRITAALRELTNKPLIVKLTPEVSDIGELGLAAQEGGADILSAINTFIGMAINVKKRKAVLGTVTGGFSGPALKPLALAKVYDLCKVVSIPIIGIGGIFTVNDVIEYLMAGASAIQVGTANYIEPKTSEKLVDDLQEYCKVNNIASINELIGIIK